ncbi:MAG: response regulator [Zetaproteobacteria bacterium]|nr:response regulator [Zetaproteobacteria bacterium]
MSKILVVDDSKFQRRAIVSEIQKLGHETMEAVNGESALELLAQESFDAMITDLHMPIMTGFELLKEIQSKGIQIKSVVLSADIQKEVVNEVKDLGARGFLSKPVDSKQLKEILESIL